MRKYIIRFAILLSVIVAILFIRKIWLESKQKTTQDVYDFAHSLEVSLAGKELFQLEALPEDESKEAYKVIKNKLISLVKINTDARFIYFFKKINGSLFFMVDSEPPISKDYSPPGQQYSEEDPQAYLPFENGKPIITQPTTDRWGTWVSALIPIKNPTTGEIYAVLGIDYPAKKWQNQALMAVIDDIIIVIIFYLLLLAIYIILKKNNDLQIRNNDLKSTEDQMAALTGVIEQSDDIIVVKDLNLRIVAANKAIVNILGKNSVSELIGKTDAELFNMSADIEPVKTYMSDEIKAQSMKFGEYILREEKLITAKGNTRILLTKNIRYLIKTKN